MSAGNEIGDLLLDIGLISPEELATAHAEQAKTGERLTLVLERLGLVSYHQLKDALELQFGVNFYSLSKTPPSREVSDCLKLETKLKHRVIPIANAGTQYTIAMVNPDDLIALDSVRVELKSGHLKKVVCTADEFEFFIRDMYEVNKDGSTSAPPIALAAPVAAVEATAEVAAMPAVAAKPTGAKVPAKKHLQSLFGDDDDDDDDDDDAVSGVILPQVKGRKPAASVTSNSLPALNPDLLLGPMVSPSMAQRLLEDQNGSAADPAGQHKSFSAGSNGSALAAPSAVAAPAESAVADVAVPFVPVVPVVATAPVVPPTPETRPAAVHKHNPVPFPEDSLTATADHLPVELSIEDVVAGVASHLVESIDSNTVLSNNASRQLLEDVVESELGGMEETDIDKLKEQQNSSIMLLAHEIIGKATQKRCSDIHLEPDSSGVTLRYFLHGELLADCVLPGEIHQALVSSYKIIAGLDPNELERPQDKKIVTKVENDQVELRITTLPSDHGEMVAISMRFL